jgi:porphobilinogen synthase
MKIRPRILRKSKGIRSLVQETKLHISDFIAPLFIVEGEGICEEINSLPNYFRRSLDETLLDLKELKKIGIRAVVLFVKCEDHLKDNAGTEALNDDGLMQRSIREIKKHFPDLVVFSDVALDPYSSFGHDGIVENEKVLNDESAQILAEMALSHAKAGVDFVAPSDMMDGRISLIRNKLEEHRFTDVGIMSYSAKYASCFYGPFRDALDSAPGFGDKKSYQMDPANRKEALKEVALDINEGADIIMIKPAMAYLDIIRDVTIETNLPVSAYQVSGEYAMIKAAAEKEWLNEDDAILESLTAIKRAGASLIISYFIKDIARILNTIKN